jgi:hypothetical protein
MKKRPNKRDVVREARRISLAIRQLGRLVPRVYPRPCDIDVETYERLRDIMVVGTRLHALICGLSEDEHGRAQKRVLDAYFAERDGSADPPPSVLGGPPSRN